VVSWKAGALLLLVLAGLAAYTLLTRPRPAPPRPSFVPCGVTSAVYVKLQGQGRVLELERAAPGDAWRVTQPAAAAADPERTTTFVNAIDVIRVVNTIPAPRADAGYGLDPPREVLTCRVKDGSSYTLSIGSPSFDGSGYYARKGGDSRLYVISSIEVEQFDRALAEPPVKASPSPVK
jgi:hypothetical protein